MLASALAGLGGTSGGELLGLFDIGSKYCQPIP
jgi:hypothetical protein